MVEKDRQLKVIDRTCIPKERKLFKFLYPTDILVAKTVDDKYIFLEKLAVLMSARTRIINAPQ